MTIQLQTFAAKPRFFAAVFDRRKVMATDAFSQALELGADDRAIFVDAVCTAPGVSAPAMATVTHLLAPGTEHLVDYHLVTEGEALIALPGAPDIPIAAGDIAHLPSWGCAYGCEWHAQRTLLTAASFGQWLAGDFIPLKVGAGGGGAVCVLRFTFPSGEGHAARLFLAGLPACIRMNLRGGDGASRAARDLHPVSARDTTSNRPGRGVLLAKMAEAIFIETLRRYMEESPPSKPVGSPVRAIPWWVRVLALLHRKPCHPWSVAELVLQGRDIAHRSA